MCARGQQERRRRGRAREEGGGEEGGRGNETTNAPRVVGEIPVEIFRLDVFGRQTLHFKAPQFAQEALLLRQRHAPDDDGCKDEDAARRGGRNGSGKLKEREQPTLS
jgi:hypothetical protein